MFYFEQVVPKIKVPILFVAASDDSLCPIEYVYQAQASSKRNENIEVAEFKTTHFKIYQDEKVKTRMVSFLKKYVPSPMSSIQEETRF